MKSNLSIPAADSCAYDCISLGEVMLRLDPGESRIHTSRQFTAWEGGGEYNVTRGLRRCFKMRTAIVTSLVDNSVGRLIEDCILSGGVDTRFIIWQEDDGAGRTVRNGLNFTERGFGIRGALGVSDRGNSAASQMKAGQINWDHLFGTLGVRWFHTGGIFAALSDTTPEFALEAVKAAKKHGTPISYDLNYRPSLWKSHGGKEAAIRVNREIVKYVDVLIGNEEDFEAALGYEISDVSDKYNELHIDGYLTMVENVVADYPELFCVATTLRTVKTATINGWSGILRVGDQIIKSEGYPELEIMDRVGGGDSFASGLIYGFLTAVEPQKALDLGLAHGALAMTTPGDTSMATEKEVMALVAGKGARVIR